MNKLPAVIWALGFGCWMDFSEYLNFLEHRPRDTSDTYIVISMMFWIGGTLLFWPWRSPKI